MLDRDHSSERKQEHNQEVYRVVILCACSFYWSFFLFLLWATQAGGVRLRLCGRGSMFLLSGAIVLIRSYKQNLCYEHTASLRYTLRTRNVRGRRERKCVGGGSAARRGSGCGPARAAMRGLAPKALLVWVRSNVYVDMCV